MLPDVFLNHDILGLQGLASTHSVTISVNYNMPEALNMVN